MSRAAYTRCYDSVAMASGYKSVDISAYSCVLYINIHICLYIYNYNASTRTKWTSVQKSPHAMSPPNNGRRACELRVHLLREKERDKEPVTNRSHMRGLKISIRHIGALCALLDAVCRPKPCVVTGCPRNPSLSPVHLMILWGYVYTETL